MRDLEDVINSIKSYISEVTENSQSRINNIIDTVNVEKGDTVPATALLPRISNNVDDIIIEQRLKEINTFKNGRLNISVINETEINNVYDSAAREYKIELSYIVSDDFGKNIFFRALRMERVLTDLLLGYFSDAQEAGFMNGEIEKVFTPESVLLGNTSYSAIISGVLYKLTVN